MLLLMIEFERGLEADRPLAPVLRIVPDVMSCQGDLPADG